MLDEQEFDEAYEHSIRHNILIKVLRELLRTDANTILLSLADQQAMSGSDWSHRAAASIGKAQAYRRILKLLGEEDE